MYAKIKELKNQEAADNSALIANLDKCLVQNCLLCSKFGVQLVTRTGLKASAGWDF